MSFQRKLIYKVYTEAGTYINTLTDVVSELSVTKQISGGDSDFSFVLSRKIDDFNEGTEIEFNNRVKVYLQDSYNPNGDKLVAYGYIVSYQPYLKGKDEGVEVTCLSAISKLSNDFYRTGTASAASDLGVELTSQRVDQMMTAIINHYRSIETNSMIASPSGLTTTTDNTGTPFSFDMRFFNMKHLDALRECAKYLARYKEGGYWFYWRINTAGSLILNNVSTTADHKFIIGKHITDISGQKTIEDVINRVYFWNEKGTVDPDYLKLTADDATSQGNYDIKAEYITDSSITNSTAAALLTESRVYDKKDPKVKVQITLNGEYDLSSIEPGQTCQIFNLENNTFKIGSDEVLVIYSIEYNVDSATLEIAEAGDNFEDIVEEERQRLDKELRWFGYITQQLTAAQLGPANRTWTTNIQFSATSGADAYRKVDWIAGTIYIPTSAGSSAGVRVIDSGTTGNMSASTDYYIYLNESTFNTSASNSDTGTGSLSQGSDFLVDSGKSWSTDQWAGYIVTIGGQTKIIKSNTATVLTIEDRWTIADTTAAYTIKKMTLDVTTNKSTAAANTSIIFSNVRANAITTSEAVIVSSGTGTSSTVNYTLDGSTNIATRSIDATNIKANTITANEINTSAISIGSFGGSLDDIDNGSTYYKATLNQVYGGGYAFGGLDSNGNVKIPVDSTKMSAGSLPNTGIYIDSTGIYGRYGGVTKFSVLTSTGSGYFAGELGTVYLTTSYFRTSATGASIRMSSNPKNLIELMYDNNVIGNIESYYEAGASPVTGISLAGGVGGFYSIASASTGWAMMDMTSKYFGLYFDASSSTTERIVTNARIDADWLPYADSTYDLGSSTYTWYQVYADNMTLGGVSRSTWPSGGVTDHSSLTGVTANQHHNRSHNHGSSSDGTALIPYTCVPTSSGSGSSSGLKSWYISTMGGAIYYDNDLFINMYNYGTYGTMVFSKGGYYGCDLLPVYDNYGQIGYRSGYGGQSFNRRWGNIHGAVVVSGDLCFENDFRFTEEGTDGISLYNPKNEKIAIFKENGDLILKGKLIKDTNNELINNIKTPNREVINKKINACPVKESIDVTKYKV